MSTEKFIYNKKMIRSPQIVTTNLGSDLIALNPATGQYLALNSVAAAIFEIYSQPNTLEEVVEQLLQQYDVEPSQCAKETEACIHTMLQKELLIEA